MFNNHFLKQVSPFPSRPIPLHWHGWGCPLLRTASISPANRSFSLASSNFPPALLPFQPFNIYPGSLSSPLPSNSLLLLQGGTIAKRLSPDSYLRSLTSKVNCPPSYVLPTPSPGNLGFGPQALRSSPFHLYQRPAPLSAPLLQPLPRARSTPDPGATLILISPLGPYLSSAPAQVDLRLDTLPGFNSLAPDPAPPQP